MTQYTPLMILSTAQSLALVFLLRSLGNLDHSTKDCYIIKSCEVNTVAMLYAHL